MRFNKISLFYGYSEMTLLLILPSTFLSVNKHLMNKVLIMFN